MGSPFDFQIRVLACPSCGAPMQAPLEGGQATCEYCGAHAELQPRREEHWSEEGSATDRLAKLQAQLTRPLESFEYSLKDVPSGYEEFVRIRLREGEPDPKLDELREVWRQRLLDADAAQAPDQERRLFWLASMLDQRLALQKQHEERRVVLETAVERIEEPGYRHILYAGLAAAALQTDDLTSAEAWIRRCNPAPTDLLLDSAYRVGLARVLRGQRKPAEALEVLGETRGAIPFVSSYALLADAYRVDALETLGRDDEAWKAYLAAAAEPKHGKLMGLAMRNNELGPRTLARVTRMARRMARGLLLVVVLGIAGIIYAIVS